MLSAMDLLALIRPKHKAKPPSRGWRNWYRSLVDQDTVAGYKHAGDEFSGLTVHPSKDMAETQALAMLDFQEALAEIDGKPVPYRYLGAREDRPDA